MTDRHQSLIAMRGATIPIALVFWMLVAPGLAPVFAADVAEIVVEASAEEIFIGESVDYHVEIRNARTPSSPDLSELKSEFDVESLGDESRNQSSTFIVNGRVTQQNVFSHVYRFRLTPKSTGVLTIPPTKATIDGKSLSSNSLPLRVVDVEKQDLVLVELKANHQRVYPTQPFRVTLRVLVRPLPHSTDTDPLLPLRRRPPHLQINWADTPKGLASDDKSNWLQPLLAEDGVGFSLNDITTRSASFFDGPRLAVFGLSKGRETRDGLDGKPIEYFVYELSRTFTPEKTGTYQFGPAVVKGTFIAEFDGSEYSAKRVVAIAPAISLEVREVPTPRPPTFCGGIGTYQVAASVSPSKLRVGDPLTLTLELERGEQSGSLELISAPDLSAIPEVNASFDLIDKNPTGRIEGSTKKFAYALRPKRPGVSIPPLTVTLFNPQAETFVNVTTAAIPLEVSEASQITSGDLVGAMSTTGSTEIKSRSEGIYQNITDPSELRDERVSLWFWSGFVLAVWSLAGVVIAGVSLYRRMSSDAGWQRRQQARRVATRRLAEARASLAAGEIQQTLHHVRSALVGLIADMSNRVTLGLTATDVASVLQSAGAPSEDQAAVLGLLESIEAAEYGAGHAMNPTLAIETAAALITRITPHLARGA